MIFILIIMNSRKEYRRSYYLAHREQELGKQKTYRKENAEKIKAYSQSSVRKQYLKQYNKQYQPEYQRKYIKNRRKTDINFYLRDRLRSRLSKAVKRGQKSGSAMNDLGCSISELKEYIESKFQLGMTWENRGKEWHIDHIIPLSNFNLQNRQEFLVANNYSNLQPLWARDNIQKSNLISYTNIKLIGIT